MTRIETSDGRYLFSDKNGEAYILHRRGGVYELLRERDEGEYLATGISAAYSYEEAADIIEKWRI